MIEIKNILRGFRAFWYKVKHNNPTDQIKVIGITGTDGKSTTCELLYQILKASNKKVGIISTIGVKGITNNGEVKYLEHVHTTTPSSKLIYSSLEKMKEDGIEYVVLELTSHALDQRRAYGIKLQGAVYTNITSEHLDYHKTRNLYVKAKLRLIDMVVKDGFVISNMDDSSYHDIEKYLHKKKDIKHISYSVEGKLHNEPEFSSKEYCAYKITETSDGYHFYVKLSNLKFDIHLNLAGGMYNIQNTMAAISAAVNLGLPIKGIIEGVENTKNIEGRMNIISKSPYRIIVDFAHTQNAFNRLLKHLSENKNGGLLISVFGCAGERDKSKRSGMGEEASRYSDIIVLTSEDPRNESFEDIIHDIKKGINSKFIMNKNLFIIEDREKAIEYSIKILAKKNDTIAFLGKGHEKTNEVKNISIPWNEKQIILKYLNK